VLVIETQKAPPSKASRLQVKSGAIQQGKDCDR